MATIDDVIRTKALEVYALPDWEVRPTRWPLWIASSSFWGWYDGTSALHDEERKINGRTMGEHIDLLLCDLRCSERPAAGNLRRMIPNSDKVWKFHPPGVRLYGFAAAQGAMVVVTGALERETKTIRNLNERKRDEVKAFIRTHRLESCVLSGDILAVYPPKTAS